MDFQIVTDLPIPPRNRNGKGKGNTSGQKYRFDLLEVGHALLIPSDDDGFYPREGKLQWHRVQASASQYGKRHNVKLECRRLEDGSVGVWRTA